jgi:all-trans-8'-apo-beta-carotenal 15,15'-oxygenase
LSSSLVERAFDLEFTERSYEIRNVEGRVPAFVRGVYYSNGPARFAVGALSYRHWLDGDGMLRSLTFGPSGVSFANRFVRSVKRDEEEKAGRAVYRTFGTRFPGDRLNRAGTSIESPVNVSVWRYAGKLMAFGEQGLPWEIDPLTLSTLGPYTFGGGLNEVSPFSAHPKFDRGEMFNFGMSFSNVRPTLNLYRFDDRGAAVYRRRIGVPDPCTVHDFCLSPSYCLVYLTGYVLDVSRLIEAGGTMLESLSWEPARGSRLLVASRETGRSVARVPLGPRYCLHTVNAFEEDGHLVFDLIELEEPVYPDYEAIPDLFTRVRPACAVRYVIDTATWRVVERRSVPSTLAHDFPTIDPRRARRPAHHLWMLSLAKTGEEGRKLFDQLTHVDLARGEVLETLRLPEGFYFGSEATFIPHPQNEEEGLLLVKRFDAEHRRDAYLLLDPHHMNRGPVAVLHLEEATPPCFHGSYYPATAGTSR